MSIKPTVNDLNWKIAGEAGYGIKSVGLMFSKICTRGGLQIFDYSEYPSLVRGGHNTYQVNVGEDEKFAPKALVSLLVALNQDTIDFHRDELEEGGGLVYDNEDKEIDVSSLDAKKYNLFPIPLTKLAEDAGGKKVMRNSVALGASVGLISYDFELLKSVIEDAFKKKGDEIVNMNIKIAEAGYKHAKDNFDVGKFPFQLKAVKGPKRMVLTANEAIALGAIQAGCKFMSAYPMTPASSILHYMAANQEKHNLVVKQTEDELSAMTMALGANFAGVRSFTCTSGGGFSLMVEALGLSGITETPMVIAEVMRPGPATGLPTWTEQGDLRFLIHAAQGEFPRIVIAPGDAREAFYGTHHAFNLAEKYQMPVFVLSDKFISESYKSEEFFDTTKLKIERGEMMTDTQLKKVKEYKRYKFTDTGVSPRSIPGQKDGVYNANSDEHDEFGYSVEDAENRVRMVEKRAAKLEEAAKDLPEPILYGLEKADITLIAWGSTKGPILEAMKLCERDKLKVNLLHVMYAFPFPTERVNEVIKNAKDVVIVENNSTAQLGSLIREFTGHDIEKKLLKYSGRQFYPNEIHEYVSDILSK
ncbi:2-oxoacid:acceptor oxidoreductase subunit alpha [Patescibacteria group bacterium]|nr:2-oxoacid:acceptor oxidoreductase subunit alpha [Patescibacteria group bacterium]MBU1075397.1 2-oxoacid:acceptor oxidoreductase subunit alpha [Patescibacteria group bacterium]MBU1952454.1 2-oxoacid:acceptor oxidoreductase subunit alpha [Patescibacteria group bacterium]